MKKVVFIQDHPAFFKTKDQTGEYGELIADALIRAGVAKEDDKPEKPKKGETPG